MLSKIYIFIKYLLFNFILYLLYSSSSSSSSSSSQLPEEVELVWNDQVAPETCVDFDAPDVGMGDVFYAYGWMLLFLGGVYGLISWSDPEARQPVARREFVIPFNGLKRELGEDDDSEEE